MTKRRQRKGGKRATHAELRALEQELDRVYARMRARALYEWSLRQGERTDPADAKVSVHITTGNPAPSAPPPKANIVPPRPLLLKPKQHKSRHKSHPPGRIVEPPGRRLRPN
ncbi:MAG TPA: hypothetical protein VFJ88_04380 [Chthoniobacterales bacterium]|nr:hypothetical protein [Chthoniobacterales bacterium]